MSTPPMNPPGEGYGNPFSTFNATLPVSAPPSSTSFAVTNFQPSTPSPGPESQTATNAESGQSFLFVDNASSSKQKRSHVMKHHIQEKKRGKGKGKAPAGQATSSSGSSTGVFPWRKHNRLSPGRSSGEGLAVAGSPVKAQYNSPENPPLSSASTASSPLTPIPITPSQWPQNTISASKPDPFDTLPITPSDEVQDLIDCWTSKLSYWSGQNPHMKVDIFRYAMLHPMTFHVMILTYTARYRAHVQDLQDSSQVVRYASSAQQMVDDYVHRQLTGGLGDDKAIFALTALSLQEDRYGSKPKANQNIETAMQMMRPRAGQSILCESFMHWVQYTMSVQDPYLDRKQASQLVSFLRDAEALAFNQSQPQFLSQVPRRRDVCQYTTPLHLLLSTGPHPTHVSEAERVWVVKYGSLAGVCRTAAMIYITATLWDLRESADHCRLYLDSLMAMIYERGFDRDPAFESFLFTLLQEPYSHELKNPWRAWGAGGLLNIVKKLPPLLNGQFDELLLSFLMLKPPDFGISVSKFEKLLWEYVSSDQGQQLAI